MRFSNRPLSVFGLALVLIAFTCAAAQAAIVSFEASEGFPASIPWPTNIDGMATPVGIVENWSIQSTADHHWYLDATPPGTGLTDLPAPVSGRRIAVVGITSEGDVIATMDLVNSANLTLSSFHWAWRGNGVGVLEVSYYDINEKLLGTDTFSGGIGSNMEAAFQLATPSQGAALSRVVFHSRPVFGGGTFLLDDLNLSKVGSSATTKEVSAFQASDTTPPIVNVPFPAPDSTVKGNVTIKAKFSDTGSGINTSSARILLDGVDVTSRAKVTGVGFTLTPASPLAKGLHRVEVSVSDKAGNKSNRTVWRFGVDVPVPVKVEFDKGRFLVGGEPYFPMGIYNGSCDPSNPDNSYLVQAAESGINFQLLGESASLEHLDTMLKYGMKGMKAINAALGAISEADTSAMISMANATKDHPATLAWWACDPETVEESRKNLGLGYRTLKEKDPNHPIVWVLSHTDKYKEGVASNDAAVVYFYPILYPDGNFTVVSIYDVSLKKAFEAVASSDKQVWFGVQGIDYRLNAGKPIASPEEFRPTVQEMRAMYYLALAKGVKGLFLWAADQSLVPSMPSDLAKYPSQWKETLKIAGEVRHLSPTLAIGKDASTVRLEQVNSAIHYRELEHEGRHILIAVNVASHPVKVTWEFSEPVKPSVLFEDRVLSKSAVQMVDEFKPLEVHIYQWP